MKSESWNCACIRPLLANLVTHKRGARNSLKSHTGTQKSLRYLEIFMQYEIWNLIINSNFTDSYAIIWFYHVRCATSGSCSCTSNRAAVQEISIGFSFSFSKVRKYIAGSWVLKSVLVAIYYQSGICSGIGRFRGLIDPCLIRGLRSCQGLPVLYSAPHCQAPPRTPQHQAPYCLLGSDSAYFSKQVD